MNIFKIYKKKIKDLILNINKNGKIEIPENLDSIGVDIPPNQFKSHISTNVAMIPAVVNLFQKIPKNTPTARGGVNVE